MANDDSINNRPATVELRSSGGPGGPTPNKDLRNLRLGGGKSGKDKWLVVGTAAVVVIILAGGVWVGLRSRGQNEEGNTEEGIFGELPLGGEREESEAAVSGLSGRECEEPNRRAIAVMLAGDPINRPVSGFAQADQVWELPVLVSGVTRLMGVYQCGRPDDIGSVRSVRHDYLFLAEGLDAIMSHWGGSYHALNRIDVGEFQTLSALANPHNAFFRKNHLPAPYNGFTTYERLWNALQKQGFRVESKFEGYEFKDDASESERGAGGKLSIAWPGAFRVHYEYDQATNRYQRFWAGVKQVDGGDNTTPVAPSAVVIIRAANGPMTGPGGYNDVAIEGEGEAIVYQDGQEIKGRWKKNELQKTDRMKFMNEAGEEIALTRGQVWVMAVAPGIAVTWEPVAATSAAPVQ